MNKAQQDKRQRDRRTQNPESSGDPIWTDKDYDKDRQRLLKLADKWIGPLGLKWWKVDLVYSKTPLRPVTADEHARDMHVAGTCDAQWQYLAATLTFDMVAINGMDDDELEYAFVHELCHALVNELQEQDPRGRHEDRVVTHLAKAFIWVASGDGREDQNSPHSATRAKRKLIPPAARFRTRGVDTHGKRGKKRPRHG